MSHTDGGLDMAKLRGMQKDIAKKAGQGDGNFIYSNKLPEEMDFKIAPPPDEALGVYFIEQQGWWVDGKFCMVNSTPLFDGVDVIQEEIDAAKDAQDDSLDALINKKNNNIPVLKFETRYLIPGFQLDVTFDNNDQVSAVKVVDDDCKVLFAKPTLLTAINKVVTSRPFQNGTKYGAADRVKGAPIILGKTGAKLKTVYSATPWNQPLELDEKYYDEKKLSNVFEITRKMAKSDTYLRSVIRNYLYGDAIIEDPKEEKEEGEAKTPARTPSNAGTSARPSTTAKKVDTTTDEANSEVAPVKKAPARSILADAASAINDLD